MWVHKASIKDTSQAITSLNCYWKPKRDPCETSILIALLVFVKAFWLQHILWRGTSLLQLPTLNSTRHSNRIFKIDWASKVWLECTMHWALLLGICSTHWAFVVTGRLTPAVSELKWHILGCFFYSLYLFVVYTSLSFFIFFKFRLLNILSNFWLFKKC